MGQVTELARLLELLEREIDRVPFERCSCVSKPRQISADMQLTPGPAVMQWYNLRGILHIECYNDSITKQKGLE